MRERYLQPAMSIGQPPRSQAQTPNQDHNNPKTVEDFDREQMGVASKE